MYLLILKSKQEHEILQSPALMTISCDILLQFLISSNKLTLQLSVSIQTL